jgi:hypothetical protein
VRTYTTRREGTTVLGGQYTATGQPMLPNWAEMTRTERTVLVVGIPAWIVGLVVLGVVSVDHPRLGFLVFLGILSCWFSIWRYLRWIFRGARKRGGYTESRS